MKEISEYYIVSSLDVVELSGIVNKWIKDGWQPLDRPFLRNTQFGQYHQAMVKYIDI